MANNIYTVDLIATGSETISLTDDGSGIDEISVVGLYDATVAINLNWTSDTGHATSGEGNYFTAGNIGHRLIVNGVIENATGSNGHDFIQGNELGNVIYGDAKTGGLGLSDTLWGAAGDDTIYGGAGDDGIQGDDGFDRLFGGIGNDTVTGGFGADILEGGTGADVLYGGATARDTVSYAASSAGVRIAITFGAASTGIGGDAAGDSLSGFYDAIGSAFADLIEDTEKGTVAFGQNDNAFYGANGRDLLLLGGGNDTGQGGAGDDRIIGEVGDDLLYGGSGNDDLRGGLGRDRLTGDGGADQFIFALAAESTVALAQRDSILDFNQAEHDQIDLSGLDARVGLTGNQAFHFIGANPFSAGSGALRAVIRGDTTLIYGDTNGDKTADFAILLKGAITLTEADFVL